MATGVWSSGLRWGLGFRVQGLGEKEGWKEGKERKEEAEKEENKKTSRRGEGGENRGVRDVGGRLVFSRSSSAARRVRMKVCLAFPARLNPPAT